MKSNYLSLIICTIIIQPVFAMDKILEWQFTNPKNQKIVSLGEKGSIQEALMQNRDLPDPFIGMNENLFGWIEEYEWTLTSEFTLTEDEILYQLVDLELPSVDTYAKIYLNGKLILTCDNAFLPYRININKWGTIGKNELKAVFTPPVLYHKEMYEKAPYKLPAPNDVHKIAIAPYTRKPQYQFGWDWALRMNTIGFNKPVKIVSYQENKIIGTNIQTISIENNRAVVSISLQLANQQSKELIWSSQLFGKIDWKKEGQWLKAIVHIDQPELWWPKNHGEQFLYEDVWTLTNKNGNVIDQTSKKFGIRTVQLRQDQDAFGTSYEIVVNGRKIFCKGGNYIPQDIFPSRVTDENVRNIVNQMANANFNMVRVWGGGYYPDAIFYNECDRLGIMVWQDFMFACSMYPGTDEFLDNVKHEINYHIPRITSHPSVVLMNGNNEVDIAWKNWGFQLKYGLIGKSVKEIEKAYTDLFQTLIPERMLVFSTVPYIHTSPLSHWGKDEYYNHGSQHYWGVWHGKDPIEDFGNKSGRFNAEYGFQSFPEYSTLTSVIDKKDWYLDSEVMKHRQKSYVGNKMIKKHSDILFGETDDFGTFIYYSQLTQARGVSIAIAAHRTNWPKCTGTIYWQINDCWPAPTWSSVDYYGNWKALHYEAKKDYESIAVVAVERKLNQKEFYLVSDWTEAYQTDIYFDFYDLNGKWLSQYSFFTEIEPQIVVDLPVFSLMDKPLNDYIAVASWKDKNGKEVKRTFHNLTSPPSTSNEPKTTIELKTNENGTTKLLLTTDKPLLNCWIYSESNPFHLDRNFETLLPGTHEFELKSQEPPSIDDIKIRFTN
jgi:beta-mannosidase